MKNTPRFTMFMAMTAIALMLCLSVCSETQPPKEPILRIETGMHTAQILRIGIDAQNRYLATVAWSDDGKWLFADGKYNKILAWSDAGRFMSAENNRAVATLLPCRRTG